MDNRLKKLAQQVSEGQQSKQPTKANRTLSLTEPEFTVLQKYCRTKGYKVSTIIDELISMFLEEVKDDLPPEL